MITPVAQRWRKQRGVYVPPDSVIYTRAYEVGPLEESGAKAFILEHHYSGTFPSARWCFGLYKHGLLYGVAVFSHPANDKVLTNIFPGRATDSTELGRLVLLDEVPGNGESWFVRRCLDVLRREGLVGVVSFSDPIPRTDVTGKRVFRGHIGNVYQALGGRFTGRGKADTLRLCPDGAVFSNRAASKIRSGEQGARYAVGQLVAHGAAPLDVEKASEEERRAWLRRWRAALTRPLRHPGNYRYVWALDRKAEKHMPPAQPYPKFQLAEAA